MEKTMKQAINQATDQLGLNDRPELTAPTAFVKNFGQFERIGATYTHRICQPRKNPSVGHSKPANQPEPADKQQLLKNIIRRLASNPKNYLAPGCYIMFYHNRSNFDRDSIKLFTLYSDRWEPEPHILTWSWLIQFLNQFYTPTVVSYVQDLSGNTVDNPKSTAPPISSQPPTKHSNSLSMNMRFNNMAELNDYCQALIKDGQALGLVGDYMYKMALKHNWGNGQTTD